MFKISLAIPRVTTRKITKKIEKERRESKGHTKKNQTQKKALMEGMRNNNNKNIYILDL